LPVLSDESFLVVRYSYACCRARIAFGMSLIDKLLVPFHWPVLLSLYLTSNATFGNVRDLPLLIMMFLKTEALTAPALKVISGFDIFRKFHIDWN